MTFPTLYKFASAALLGLFLTACSTPPTPASDALSTQALPGNAKVCFYEHNDFYGASFCQDESAGNVRGLDKFNNLITSVRVAPGYKVTLYPKFSFRGRSLTLSKDDTDLTGEDFNDRVSSFKISQADTGDGDDGEAPGPNPDPKKPDGDLEAACTPSVTLNLEDKNAYRSGLFLDVSGDDPEAFLQDVGRKVCGILYKKASEVRDATSLELILRNDPDTVAYKSGNGGDIEVMISTDHLKNVDEAGRDVAKEIKGILFHEMTHMYQQDDSDGGGADIGVIEGIADFVRFKSGFAPDGAQPNKSGNWNDGYRTTAFFLVWMDETYPDSFYELNKSLDSNDGKTWTPAAFKDITGKSVDTLWQEYVNN